VPFVPFLPYGVIGIVHLAALASGADLLATFTKPILLPLLLVALLWGLGRALPRVTLSELTIFAALGVLLSWAGDVLLGAPGGSGFLFGLGSFLLAHVAYLLLFLRPLRRRRPPWAALVLVLWWAALLLVLAPHLGVLLVPVAIYGLVLGVATAAAFGTNAWVSVGALLLLASDTLLALTLFLPEFSPWQADFLIMLLYLAGEGLIVFGAVRSIRLAGRSAPRVPETAVAGD
jgi:uncharacterized membrane protein YhhN